MGGKLAEIAIAALRAFLIFFDFWSNERDFNGNDG